MGALETLYRRYESEVAFFVIYIREAHPEDGWVLDENRESEIAIRDPATLLERAQAATACHTALHLPMPVLLDGPEDGVALRYGGWPDRLYLIGKNGRIEYQGGEGPFGFRPEDLARAIEAELKTVAGAGD